MLRFKNAAITAALLTIAITACRQAESPTEQALPTLAEPATTTTAITYQDGEALIFEEFTAPEPARFTVPDEAQAVEAASHSEPLELKDPGAGRYLTWGELDAAGAEAGWPEGPWLMMRNIVYCETGGTLYTHASNGSDPNGGSHGLAQLNGSQHFTRSGENFELRYDPVVNLRVALWLWEARGRIFGGSGGWYFCSIQFGYD